MKKKARFKQNNQPATVIPPRQKFWPRLKNTLSGAMPLLRQARSGLRLPAQWVGRFCIILMIPGVADLGYRLWCWLAGAKYQSLTIQQGLVWLLPQLISVLKMVGWQAEQGVLGRWAKYLQCCAPPDSLVSKAPIASCLLIGFVGLVISEWVAGPPAPPPDGSKPQ